MKNIFFYQTSIGRLGITDNGAAVTNLYWNREDPGSDCEVRETALLKQTGQELREYLAGVRRSFDLPLAPEGTEFQQAVWKVLQNIPYGQTWSYKQVAEAVGRPRASRAVGGACNKNPLSILIPCHRVIGANGRMVGYGGGLDKKEYLLQMEKAYTGS